MLEISKIDWGYKQEWLEFLGSRDGVASRAIDRGLALGRKERD